MSRIGKIAKPLAPGTTPKRVRPDILPPVPRKPAQAPTRSAPRRAPVSYAQIRPETGFLAQYVDQFSPWTVQPKTAKRQTAKQAYGQADLLIEEMFLWRRQQFDRRF